MIDKHVLTQASKILAQGGIIIFPTDTAFGIGCLVDNEEAVKKLFTIRKRPLSQAVPVLVQDQAMAQRYLQPLPTNVISLMKTYWPGGLTIVCPCQTNKIAPSVYGLGDSLGVRQPNHEVPLGLLQQLNIPLIGPSANFHGEKTPFIFSDLNPELVKLVDYVIPGECHLKQASTVIDCTSKPWRILRQGAVKVSSTYL